MNKKEKSILEKFIKLNLLFISIKPRNKDTKNNNIITTEADNVLSTRATRSNTFNINNGKNHRDNDISPTIKRTIKLFDMKSQSIHSYRSGRFDLPLITSIDMNTNKK